MEEEENLAFEDPDRYNLPDQQASQPINSVEVITESLRKIATDVSPEIKAFKGKGSASDFLDRFEVFAQSNEWTAATKLLRVTAYLKKQAFTWLLNRVLKQLKTGLDNRKHMTILPISEAVPGDSPQEQWDNFCYLLKDEYPGVRSQERKLEILIERDKKKEETLSNYVSDKVCLCLRYNELMSEQEQITYVKKGLPRAMQEKLMVLNIKSLSDLLTQTRLIQETQNLYGKQPEQQINMITTATKHVKLPCYRCGVPGHSYKTCRMPVICWYCKKRGHKRKQCPNH